MTHDQAMARLSKLREVTVEHGATEHEAATARALARRLCERFGLERPAVGRPAVLRPQVARYAATPADRRSSRSLRFVAFG